MRRALPWLVAVTGLVLVVVGMTLFATARTEPVEYGWYAYTPLSPVQAYESRLSLTFDGTVVWDRQQLTGLGCATGGAVLLAAVAGWGVGRRARRAPSAGA